MFADPAEQCRNVGRHSRRFREHVRVIGRRLVDNGETCFDGGAVLGIDRAGDRGGEHHAAAFLQSDEGVAPG